MRRTILLAMLVAVLLPLAGQAQQPVRLGGHTFVPGQNVVASSRDPHAGWGAANGGKCNVLVQLRTLPSSEQIQQLARQGILLGDYLGGNAYWALVDPQLRPQSLGRGTPVTAIVPVRSEWKLAQPLQKGEIPDYARAGAGGAMVVVRYAENAKPPQVTQALAQLGLSGIEVVEQFRAAYAQMPLSAACEVASLPWVRAACWLMSRPCRTHSAASLRSRAWRRPRLWPS